MSDHPREVQRKMERIFLCNDIWWDCLPFLSRAKVGLAFALVSDRFDRMSDRHLGSKKRPWTLGRLGITQKQGDAIILNWDTKKYLPLADGPLPENVIGFKYITIYYVDHKVIDFLRRIRRLFQPKNNGEIGLNMDISSTHVPSWDIFFESIWPLINPSAITKLYFRYNSFAFCRHIWPTFLRDLANLRVVSVWLDGESNGQLLWQWLHTPRADGKPKLLKNCYVGSNAVEHLKTKFFSAKIAVNFVIGMKYNGGVAVPFEMDNRRTGERLTFRKVDGYKWLLERGPIGGRNVEKWEKWEREAMEWGVIDQQQKHNLLGFSFNDNAVGPLDESAGSSGQQQPQQKRIKLDEK